MFTPRVPACVLGLCAAVFGAHAAADEPYYKGKRLSLIINFAAGGPTDIEGRLLAKHLVKHIDGHPGIVVQNRELLLGLPGRLSPELHVLRGRITVLRRHDARLCRRDPGRQHDAEKELLHTEQNCCKNESLRVAELARSAEWDSS